MTVSTEKFIELGASVESTSIPMHEDGPAIWTPIALEGLTNTMMHGNGFGTGWRGLYTTSLLTHHANWRARSNELSASLKLTMFVGEYMQKHYRGQYYAKAQNLSRALAKAYDDALQNYDLLVMPTLPMKATPLPPPDAPIPLIVQRAFEMVGNIARHHQESTIYRAAHAFEQAYDWKSLSAE